MADVTIVEVGARDGLQNEPEIVSTADKLGLITRMIDAGVRRVEVASFVNPKRVPQMADAEAVIAGLPDRRDVSYIGLCLNKRGVLRAIESREGNKRGVDEAGCVLVASNTFGERNQGQTIDQGIAENREMLRLARENGLVAQVTISAAFGCPFEGYVPPETVVRCVEAMAEAGAEEIALADTIGVGVPAQVTDLFGRVRAAVGDGIRLRAHFHNTRGTGIANAWAAYAAGVNVLDSSLGGLGGCPFAPKAAGNISTEELLFMLDASGVSTGLDLAAAIATNHWFATVMGRTLPSMVAKAGPRPGEYPAANYCV
ncbi:hydroxymethylglutaryl-CoA lyase [Sphingosinicella microcystinivorans]|uniref:Hydroxymethylglutaryl-CoA lyase n=1 Tax=Sphingosinicella microcystinivorans TaxID=335406 RepID=A0AAD1D9I9_SPHMI|nr:hydroxymethylglutaryl-CoA lyase [Sphingosinicella microcystinivorans]RKS88233.1 hydroxymethylglutaryl-CoA lyase [Sphingosinicella microcystinivorans]BBE36045.1 hydroxymethylglutaryl-CoA lyase [Sphingosinicella microcystinivorans]